MTKDNPMTGDGAVVLREWDDETKFADAVGAMSVWTAMKAEHNAAIRRQAAEIERLTVDYEQIEWVANEQVNAMRHQRERAEAFEARTADLLKALERYGRHTVNCEKSDGLRPDPWKAECTCGFQAAAKGETV